MAELVDIALGLPTAIFTTLLAISLGFWLITLVFGIGDGGLDGLDGGIEGLDGGLDAIEGGIDGAAGSDGLDGGSDTGNGGGLLAGIGLDVLPLTVTITLVSLVGWFVSAMGTLVLGDSGSVGIVTGIVIGLAALAVAVVVAARVGTVLAPVFVPARHIGRRDLLGRICTVRTGRVDAAFGQAEVVDAERSTHLVQVRCAIPNELRAGSPALIVDVDHDGHFVVSPDVAGLT